ncbi:L-asparaginase 1 [Candidatus Uabimicrobium amorphum]|uniref:asparaginase n=2 Tax=Uabimicrobium amorphum TaxID=2596890 RepID=A0A5S9ILH9_UABAM|nr:L-asparaginase 1 [Candidatus Uabimicrobium amorphum]
MIKEEGNYVPAPPGYITKVLNAIPEFHRSDMPDFVIDEYTPAMDSANMAPKDWVAIGDYVAKNYHDFDGFIILHGTDTMAYTASALAFMLKNLGKPVILTGSQIPLSELRSDGRDNIIAAAIIAQQFEIPEVCLYFGEKLYRGCRAVKVNASGFGAFISPNLEPLATAGIKIKVREDLLLPMPTYENNFEFIPFAPDVTVTTVRIFPGFSPLLLQEILKAPLQGLVIEAYGIGNIPESPELVPILEEAVGRGVLIAVCSQCLLGEISLQYYRGGSVLQKCGVVNGGDMTIESALAKMIYLFTLKHEIKRKRMLMAKNLRGELTCGLYSTLI